MIATIGVVVFLTLVGVPFAAALHPNGRWSSRLGEAFFLGCGWTTTAMLVLSVVHIRWALPTVCAAAAVPSLLLLPIAAKRVQNATRDAAPAYDAASVVIDLLTSYLVITYAIYATLASMWELDFWAIFGVKARAFFEFGGVDWSVLRSPFNLYTNPDYPLALPLLFDLSAITNGTWDDRWIGILYPAFTIALLLVVRPLVARETDSPVVASAVMLVIAALSFTETAGTAEAPLVALSGAALLMMRRAILDDDSAAFRMSAVLLGIAALVKNEGIAMIAAAAFAVVIATRNWRRAVSLWPAVACGGAWLVIVRLFDLKSAYLRSESMLQRLLAHVEQLPDITRALVANTPTHPLFWAAALMLLLIAFREAKRESFLLTFIVVQLLLYIAAYLVTSHPVVWQIHNSWARLLSHIAIPLAFAAVASALRWRMPQDAPVSYSSGRKNPATR